MGNRFKITFTYDSDSTNDFSIGTVTLTINDGGNIQEALEQKYKNPVIVDLEKV